MSPRVGATLSKRFDKIALLLKPLAHNDALSHLRRTMETRLIPYLRFYRLLIAEARRAGCIREREISCTLEVKLCCLLGHRLRSRSPSDRRGNIYWRHMAAFFSPFPFSEKKKLRAASADSPRRNNALVSIMIPTRFEGRALRQDKTHL